MFFGLLLQGKEYVYHALRRDAELVLELLGLRPETEIRTEKIDMASCSLERALVELILFRRCACLGVFLAVDI